MVRLSSEGKSGSIVGGFSTVFAGGSSRVFVSPFRAAEGAAVAPGTTASDAPLLGEGSGGGSITGAISFPAYHPAKRSCRCR